MMDTFTFEFIMSFSDWALEKILEKICPWDVERKRKGEHSEDVKKSSWPVEKECNCNCISLCWLFCSYVGEI